MRSPLPIAALLLTLAAPAAAQADPRYAAPGGSGPEPCAQGSPCSLKEAVSKAKAGDEVIVTTGAYTVTESIFTSAEAAGLHVHGDFGGPRPTITGSVGSGHLIGINAPSSRLSYLDLANSANFGAAVLCMSGATVERSRLFGKGQFSSGLQISGACVARDSVVGAEGETSRAILAGPEPPGTAILRNLTAIASGPKSTGVTGVNNSIIGGNSVVSIRNSIVDGGEYDLLTVFGGFGGKTTIDVAHSNFDTSKADYGTIAPGPGNQTQPPLFVDAANRDYHQAAGSPTIDAGVVDQLGTTDYDGSARSQGPAPDIGAFEAVAPPVSPAPLVPAGEITALAISPKTFAAANVGGAILSARKKAKAPVTATVTYALTRAATVDFTVERKVVGRKAGKRCVKQTRANKDKKKCPLFKPVKGGFAHTGSTGPNSFKFTGRVVKALAPGSYRLTGKASASSRTANFRVVR